MKSSAIDVRRKSLGYFLKGVGILVYLCAACFGVAIAMVVGVALYFNLHNYRVWLTGLLGMGICISVAWGGVELLRAGGRRKGSKSTTAALVGASTFVLIFAVLGYFCALPTITLMIGMSDAVVRADYYLDSLTPSDVQAWINRSKILMAHAGPNYVSYSDKDIPEDLRKLKIIRIDASSDQINYVWMGGFDHTELEVEGKMMERFRLPLSTMMKKAKLSGPSPSPFSFPLGCWDWSGLSL